MQSFSLWGCELPCEGLDTPQAPLHQCRTDAQTVVWGVFAVITRIAHDNAKHLQRIRDPMRLLAVGDIHLGRLPTRIPEDFALPASELGPAAAWRSTVELAIHEQVHAVLLAGDVVESEKDFFEGFRELKSGVEKLTQARISVVAVAGNHDVEVLPRLAASLGKDSGFTLLGQGGSWQPHSLANEATQVRIWGWSFPQRKVRDNPLSGARLDRGADVTLGLLHCDLGQSTSVYAPVRQADLMRTGLDGWLLGHIHVPHQLTSENLIGYLGCLTGMDPGEPGARGPWLLDIGEGRIRDVRQIPIAPLRWEVLCVDLSNLEDIGDLEQNLIAQAEEFDKERFEEGPLPKAVGLRVRFVGRTAFARELDNWIESATERPSHFPVGDRHYLVEQLEAELLPEVGLDELSRRQDPLGLLAKRLLLLDQPKDDPERRALLDAAAERFENRLRSPTWRGIEPNADNLSEEAVIEQLRLAGTAALHKLFAQQQHAIK